MGGRPGQSSGERHEKDDRHHIDDRSRFVLGWSNRQKILALEDDLATRERELQSIGARSPTCGRGWPAWAQSPWLAQRRVTYWGDLDTQGFAILHQLRAALPATRSMLMDRSTLEACRDRWGTEAVQVTRDLPLLAASEQEAYDLLRDQRLGRNLRLEQELIPQHLLTHALRDFERANETLGARFP